MVDEGPLIRTQRGYTNVLAAALDRPLTRFDLEVAHLGFAAGEPVERLLREFYPSREEP